MLQWHLQEKPDPGDIVRGSGGVRKVRWAPEGKGKENRGQIFHCAHPMPFIITGRFNSLPRSRGCRKPSVHSEHLVPTRSVGTR